MDGLAHCATSVFDILGVSMDPAKNPGSATATRVGVDSSVIRYKFESLEKNTKMHNVEMH